MWGTIGIRHQLSLAPFVVHLDAQRRYQCIFFGKYHGDSCQQVYQWPSSSIRYTWRTRDLVATEAQISLVVATGTRHAPCDVKIIRANACAWWEIARHRGQSFWRLGGGKLRIPAVQTIIAQPSFHSHSELRFLNDFHPPVDQPVLEPALYDVPPFPSATIAAHISDWSRKPNYGTSKHHSNGPRAQ